MKDIGRKFEDSVATREGHSLALIIGITAPQGSGKTWSALRLATGIQRVVGGEIYGIDTEDDRMLAYADYFTFRHVPFKAPYGPDDYRAAINHCVKRGASVIIIDQMSSEHDDEGGVLDQIEQYIEGKGGGEQHKWTAHIIPKRARKKLNREITHLAKSVVFILLYRAEEKTRPGSGGKAEKLGLQAVSTSNLPYFMTVRFLLPPASDGVPILQPTQPAERILIKNPEQFKGWFISGEPLCEAMGERMATWARGGSGADEFDRLIGEYNKCSDAQTFERLKPRRTELWAKDSPKKPKLKEASDGASRRIKELATRATIVKETSAEPDVGEGGSVNWEKTLSAAPDLQTLETTWKDCIAASAGDVSNELDAAYQIRKEMLGETAGKELEL